MTNEDLTDITGVGSGKADQLRDAGFDTVDDVAQASADELANADGFGEGNAGDIIENASVELAGDVENDGGADAEESDGESAGSNDTADADAVDENSSADELFNVGTEDVPWSEEDVTKFVGPDVSEGDDTYLLDLETDAQILVHTIHVVLEEATSQHQSTNIPLRDTTYSLARKLMAIQMESGELVDAKIVLTSEELSAFYRALTSGSSDYASRSGIPSMWAEFESLRTQVNEKRKEAMAA